MSQVEEKNCFLLTVFGHICETFDYFLEGSFQLSYTIFHANAVVKRESWLGL